MRRAYLIFVLVVSASACSDSKKVKPDVAPDSAKTVLRVDTLDRPVGKVTRVPALTKLIETNGRSIAQGSTLESSPPTGFPVKFSTYKPDDMLLSFMSVGTTVSVTFTGTGDAASNRNAYMVVQFDTTALAPRDPADTAFAALTLGRKLSGLKMEPGSGFPWATAAKTFRFTEGGERIAGRIVVGARGAQKYRIFAQYPIALKTAMESRINMVLTQWRWEDDFTYLVPAPLKPLPKPADTTAAASDTTAPAKKKK